MERTTAADHVHSQTLKGFLSKAPSKELVFERVPFHHPHIVAYSSGTTGLPKCIVHAGGVRDPTLEDLVQY